MRGMGDKPQVRKCGGTHVRAVSTFRSSVLTRRLYQLISVGGEILAGHDGAIPSGSRTAPLFRKRNAEIVLMGPRVCGHRGPATQQTSL